MRITAEEALQAKEVMLFGGGSCSAVTRLQGCVVGDGKPGPVFRAFHAALEADMPHPPSGHLDPIPGLA